MSSENLYDVIPQNCNMFSHKELSLYIKSVLHLYILQPLENDMQKKKIVEAMTEDIGEYDALLEKHFSSDFGKKIDKLEKDRYSAFETFIDAIDEIQNIEIIDPFNVLYSLNVDCEEARFLLPRYQASHKLLVPLDGHTGWGAHYSPGECFGHCWPVRKMNECIEHLRSPGLCEYFDLTGLGETAQKLLKSDENVLAALCDNEDTLTLDNLNSIREFRSRIVICINFMYMSIPQCNCNRKDETVYEAHVVFHDRLIEKTEIELFSATSFNDLSHSQLIQVAKSYEHITDKKSEYFEILRPQISEKIDTFQNILNQFQRSMYWDEFQETERKLLSTLDLLLCALSLNLRCIVGAEHELLWDKHYESDCFKTASSLLEEFDKSTYNLIAGFDRGTCFRHSFQETILETWKNPVYRKGFQTLRCVGLLDDCLMYHKQLEKLCTLFVVDNLSSQNVCDLRDQRIELCLFLNVLEITAKTVC